MSITTTASNTTTALLLVDSYNDFHSEGGKVWPRVKPIAEEVRLLDHLGALVAAARVRGSGCSWRGASASTDWSQLARTGTRRGRGSSAGVAGRGRDT